MYLNRYSKLRLLAMATMLIDHIGFLFHIYELRFIGRIAMPLFVYLATQLPSKKPVKSYFISLFCLALVSQIPYMFLINLHGPREGISLNIIFSITLLLGLLIMAKSKRKAVSTTGIALLFIIPFISPILTAANIHIEYLPHIWFISLFAGSEGGRKWFILGTYSLYCLLMVPIQLIGVVALIGAWVYLHGEQPTLASESDRRLARFGRYFYPVHMLVLVGLYYAFVYFLFGA